MSFKKTTLGQLCPSSKNADLATPTDQPRPTILPRLQQVQSPNLFDKVSGTLSDLKLKRESSPTSLPSDTQTHRPSISRHNSKQSPTRLTPLAETQTQVAVPPSTRHSYREFECEYGDTDFEPLPVGFPYTGWYGAWCFACEYVRSMQALVTERMEGNGRYGMVRRTT